MVAGVIQGHCTVDVLVPCNRGVAEHASEQNDNQRNRVRNHYKGIAHFHCIYSNLYLIAPKHLYTYI